MKVAILEDYQRASPALGVFENEPVMDAAHPLASLPNVTATPHLGFVERASYEKYFGDAFDAVNAFASGKPVRVVPLF
jgi:D-3-phosphoglycerate dehydrogenase